eukprot:s1863_g6.t1
MSDYVGSVVVSPQLVRQICEEEINEAYLGHLSELNKKLDHVKQQEMQKLPSCAQSAPELEKLRTKAVARIKDFLLQKINSLKKPRRGTNLQILQRNVLVRFKSMTQFLQEHHSAVADEVKMHYVATMSSGLEMLRIAQVLQEPSITQCSRDIATAMPACELPGAVFRTYVTSLQKLELEYSPTKSDLLVTNEGQSGAGRLWDNLGLGRSSRLSGRGSAQTRVRGERLCVMSTYVGQIKSVGGAYGFIACEDLRDSFTRDVYVSRTAYAGKWEVGTLVSFTVVVNDKGKPQARDVQQIEHDDHEIAVETSSDQPSTRRPSSSWADMLDDDGDDEDRALIPEYNVDPSLSGFELLDALETAIAENHPDTMEGPPAQAEVVHVPTDTQLRQDESRLISLPMTALSSGRADTLDAAEARLECFFREGLGDMHAKPVQRGGPRVRPAQAIAGRVQAALLAAQEAPLDDAPSTPRWPSRNEVQQSKQQRQSQGLRIGRKHSGRAGTMDVGHARAGTSGADARQEIGTDGARGSHGGRPVKLERAVIRSLLRPAHLGHPCYFHHRRITLLAKDPR